MDLTGFDKIAPHLANSLVLAGFGLLLAYGIHWQLMKSGLLSKVDKKDSGIIIRLFLRYGFWLALILLLAGFALPAWNKYMDTVKVISIDARKTADNLLKGQLDKKDEQIKALTEAIAALSKTGAPVASINAALQELKQGNTAKAKVIFAEVAAAKESAGEKNNKEAAEAYRHLGALAFMNDTKAALAAYQKAVELDPDNAEGWNQLGLLLWRTGELVEAETAFRKVLALSEAHKDKEEQVWAVGNLGLVYQTRGDLDEAEELYQKGLKIEQAFGNKEGMANQYGNLGIVYEKRGNLAQAEAAWQKSLSLFQAMGHPNAKTVQQWLDELAQKKAGSSR